MAALNFSKKRQAKQAGRFQDSSCAESHTVARQAPIPNPQEWEKQIWFWRSHLDIFVEEYFSTEDKPIRFFPFQKVIARAVSECTIIDDVESRGLGKTFKMAILLCALAILYPGNKILVVSKTVRQALLTLRYIDSFTTDNPNISREIVHPIKMQKDHGMVKFKNGSEIEALAMSIDGANIRGLRKKIIYIDESAWVKTEVVRSVLFPILQYKRDIYWKFASQGITFPDFNSKLVQTSSAYLKSCDYFLRFKNTLKEIKNGDTTKFACALSYKTGVRCGIIDEKDVLDQKNTMPESSWQMEWNARFIGSTENSYFPYDLTEPCRRLEHIELVQPKSSKSRYILACDVATSAADHADNACICVMKISELSNGTFNKYLVFIRSYHGYQLEALANQIRIMCCRFPNIEKVIIDINALGEGIISLLNAPFVDDEDKEYPPMILDTLAQNAGTALPIIRGVRADNKFNARMATATRMYLENKSLHMPVTSSGMRREMEAEQSEEKSKSKTSNKKPMTMEEAAVYIETDALQYEMGNIVPRFTVSGNVVYDTTSQLLHKDRYSALSMCNEWVLCLEEENKEAMRDGGDFCIGGSYQM